MKIQKIIDLIENKSIEPKDFDKNVSVSVYRLHAIITSLEKNPEKIRDFLSKDNDLQLKSYFINNDSETIASHFLYIQ